ncbi:hypothetical protein BB561_003661 [Smittium simulii]|uniref:Protein-serine/threonine kinase n=1 Tax=Smittium simulii TaxID=133385 RepID=A0A2T9YK59_9FUNG|nr:hypothetical protein BB561_003661 [Smittium simulii]
MLKNVTIFRALFNAGTLHRLKTGKINKSFSITQPKTYISTSKYSNKIISFYDTALLSKFAKKPIKNITSSHLLSFGVKPITENKLLEYTRFCQTELPVRLAKRVVAFQNLPFIVGTNPHIFEVYRLYYEGFERLRMSKPVNTLEEQKKYSDLLLQIIQSLSQVIPSVAQGMLEASRYMKKETTKKFLDDLIWSRIGLRVIGEHQVSLSKQYDEQIQGIAQSANKKSVKNAINSFNEMDWNGSINTNLKIAKLLEQSCLFVQNMCELHYGTSHCLSKNKSITPQFIIDGDLETEFSYIPSHIEYMSLEILKNAFRASAEYAIKSQGSSSSQNNLYNLGFSDHTSCESSIEPIKLTITKGHGTVCIRIRDHGGGINAETSNSIFDYSYSTYHKKDDDNEGTLSLLSNLAVNNHGGGPIAGLGFGLPMTKLYAEYFGGSLDLFSIPAYGCDIFLKLPCIDKSLGDIQI